MANLKEVRNRIVSVGSTQQITSAMKMVSAAKLKRAQDAIIQMRPYAIKMRELLENLSSSSNLAENHFTKQRPTKNVLLVVITSNRGLCGGFNANVLKKAATLIQEDYKGAAINILAFGKKASDYFRKTSFNVLASHNDIFGQLTFANVSPIADEIIKAFETGTYDKIEIVYNQFKNAAVQIIQNEQFLPLVATAKPTETKADASDYIFEPTQAEILEDLIPRSLRTQLYKALLDSHAAEHGARMTAMHKATDNAKDLIKVLKLNYNKARQAAITGEILEIVGGSEALNN